MATFKCKMCGGTIEFNQGDSVGVCDSCGTKQTLPKTGDDVIANLFNRANNLRLKCEFDKAAQIYEKILEQDYSEAEAHWGIVLCKYGIEYVEDPKTFQRIPTCHRTLFEAVTTDADYLAAVDYSDALQQQIYESEARAIDKIQKDILAIVKNEKPFDVFICYKETDDSGKRTIDSTIANDIYYQLTQQGFKVFFAAITLEDKLGQEYEPYIFAALNSAKVMLVLGTKPEYFSAVWVKNEWSRYLQLMRNDRSKLLIPCYRDMDAYDLPEEFAHLQAQDMSKIGFINDIVRGINKVAQVEEPQSTVIKETVVSAGGAQIAPLLERAFMFLEDGAWDSADEYCEKVLDIDPKNARAYLGKLMVEKQAETPEDLKHCAEPFYDSIYYDKAYKFADGALQSELDGYLVFIEERNLTDSYNEVIERMESSNSEEEYKAVAERFDAFGDFKDAQTLSQECRDKAEEARKDKIFSEAKSKMQGNAISNYESAITLFRSIQGWRDSEQSIVFCQNKIEEIKAKEEAQRVERERLAEIARVEAERIAKRNKKIAIIATPIVCAVIAFVIILNSVIIPNSKYNNAVAMMDAGKYVEAIDAFNALDGYKDSADKINDCNVLILDGKYEEAVALVDSGDIIEAYENLVVLEGYKDSAAKAESIYMEYMQEKFKLAEKGDVILFGNYEQDNNTSNGKEGIEWLVLERRDNQMLIISKYALDCKQYHTKYKGITWEGCSLRSWLNGSFLNAAFSNSEKVMIPTVTVSADKNPDYSTDPGNATQDKVFLLSIKEVNAYFNSNSSRQCKPTAYAVAQGAYEGDNGNCWWWLRSPGYDQRRAADVDYDGDVCEDGLRVDYDDFAVRPALWIDLNS